MGRARLAAVRAPAPVCASALAAVALLAGTFAAGAEATDVTRVEAAALAAQAGDDPAALAALEQVTSIDGTPADVRETFAGASGDELEGRLAAFEQAIAKPGRGGADAAAARADAEQIVDGFPEEESAPAATADDASGGLDLDIGALWLPLAIVAAIAGALIALRLARNREAAGRLAAEEDGSEVEEAPDQLTQRARRAEESGDFAEALRLRYAAALRALQASGAVPATPSVTPARVSRELADPRSDRLVGTFERVVYGGRSAGPEDAAEARDGWPAVVRERGGAAERGAQE